MNKKRDIVRLWDGPSRVGNCVGLEVNNIVENRKASKYMNSFSPFSADAFHIRERGFFKCVGVQVKARKANWCRGLETNFFNERVRGR